MRLRCRGTDDQRSRARVAARAVARRIDGDYLQPEQLGELHAVLQEAVDRGYRAMTLSAFADLVTTRPPEADDRILLVRHDIDSNVPRARRMWDLEHGLGLVGSWFFRRSTWDLGFMGLLTSAGNEVGYHYEELATVIKERGVATAAEARELLDVAGDRLRTSIAELRSGSGLAVDVVAAHGDFANRAVGVSNVELLSDRAFRAELGVRLEAYDVEPYVSARSSDGVPPLGWSPEDPREALRRGDPVVEMLLHPRSWGAAPTANARADLDRLREGCVYRLRCRRRRRP